MFLLTPFVFFWKEEVDRYDDLNKRLQDMGFTGVYKVWAFLLHSVNHVYPFLSPLIVDWHLQHQHSEIAVSSMKDSSPFAV
jgi:hypothetical protein